MLQGGLTGLAGIFLLVALVMILYFWWGRGWFIQWLKGSMGFALLILSIMAIFTVVDVWSYHQLQAEQPLATVSVYQLDDQVFDLTLVDSDGTENRYKILGDQWQLDVRLLAWKGPVAALGAMPLYRLDRLSGRYLSLEEERNAERTVYPLTESRWMDIWSALKGHSFWLRAEAGHAVYMPLVNGAVYAVNLTPKGIVPHPMNDVAESALKGDW
ncbi:hypothetical protein ACQUQU_06470 [Thalassolituus sp. LLYu03]|uniref:hypothetical protein n=1 Tax=Thalassolituus sp. LLYu03 TaxID=3421656 RepID=UPI003D2D03C1